MHTLAKLWSRDALWSIYLGMRFGERLPPAGGRGRSKGKPLLQFAARWAWGGPALKEAAGQAWDATGGIGRNGALRRAEASQDGEERLSNRQGMRSLDPWRAGGTGLGPRKKGDPGGRGRPEARVHTVRCGGAASVFGA